MKKIFLSTLLLGLVVVSCKEQKTETIHEADNMETTTNQNDSLSVTANFVGTYEGTIPCADCEGIKTELQVNADDTYELDSEYLGEKDGKFEEKGKLVWDETKVFATLDNGSNENKHTYYFNGNEAYLVEKVGDNATKPEYKLKKK